MSMCTRAELQTVLPKENDWGTPKKESLDWDYDVVLAPVLQNYKTYEHYLPVSVFYQNIQKEGIKIA
ncbi:MAG: hypothetical protein LUE92_05030 [Clostridiales bacterium]|nr:hypothetical protein [Clostridiales bacterium]